MDPSGDDHRAYERECIYTKTKTVNCTRLRGNERGKKRFFPRPGGRFRDGISWKRPPANTSSYRSGVRHAARCTRRPKTTVRPLSGGRDDSIAGPGILSEATSSRRGIHRFSGYGTAWSGLFFRHLILTETRSPIYKEDERDISDEDRRREMTSCPGHERILLMTKKKKRKKIVQPLGPYYISLCTQFKTYIITRDYDNAVSAICSRR